jgi:DNA-directed RNA polymerase subunit N (RpoN/RPB10)
MEDEKLYCRECNSIFIVNKKYQLCEDCNYKRLHLGRSKLDVLNDKNRKINKYTTLDKKPLKTKKNKVKNIYKPTGELELFKEIWLEREHKCIHCGKYLGDELNIQYFSHKISKGRDSKLRLDKNNIDILCCECHYSLEFCGNEKFNKRKNLNYE